MDSNNSASNDVRTLATGKRPYEKPSFRYEQVFVTTALSCGKIPGQSANCNSAPKNS